jgi:hypothetical protein
MIWEITKSKGGIVNPNRVRSMIWILFSIAILAALRARYLSGWLILLLACLALAWLAARALFLPSPADYLASRRTLCLLDRTCVSFGAYRALPLVMLAPALRRD